MGRHPTFGLTRSFINPLVIPPKIDLEIILDCHVHLKSYKPDEVKITNGIWQCSEMFCSGSIPAYPLFAF